MAKKSLAVDSRILNGSRTNHSWRKVGVKYGHRAVKHSRVDFRVTWGHIKRIQWFSWPNWYLCYRKPIVKMQYHTSWHCHRCPSNVRNLRGQNVTWFHCSPTKISRNETDITCTLINDFKAINWTSSCFATNKENIIINTFITSITWPQFI